MPLSEEHQQLQREWETYCALGGGHPDDPQVRQAFLAGRVWDTIKPDRQDAR